MQENPQFRVTDTNDAKESFLRSEKDWYEQGSRSGRAYVVQSGDAVSTIMGSSSQQAVGTFLAANGKPNSTLYAGDNVWIPDNLNAYGDQTALGGQALRADNARIARAAAVLAQKAQEASLIGADGMRIGPTVERAQAMGLYAPGGAVSASAAVDPFSLVSQDYYVQPGAVSRYYQNQVAVYSDSNQPWHVRSLSFINATLASPALLLEEGGRGIMSVPYAGSQVGQHAAIFHLAKDVDTKVIAGLSVIKFGSEGFVNAYVGGTLGRQVYVQAQDEAVSFWLKRQVANDYRQWSEIYYSATDGSRRLGYTWNGFGGYRGADNLGSASFGEYFSLQKPLSPADAIEKNALAWSNQASELYQVTARKGFYFKGTTAPQHSERLSRVLSGGNTQIFQRKLVNPEESSVPLPTWSSVKKVGY